MGSASRPAAGSCRSAATAARARSRSWFRSSSPTSRSISKMSETPRLWQYNFSNYNEKARWALDHKGIAHRRRTLMPCEPRALAFSARGTLPSLDIEGQRYGDSTEIIAALERIQPDPPLYPEDPELRK